MSLSLSGEKNRCHCLLVLGDVISVLHYLSLSTIHSISQAPNYSAYDGTQTFCMNSMQLVSLY